MELLKYVILFFTGIVFCFVSWRFAVACQKTVRNPTLSFWYGAFSVFVAIIGLSCVLPAIILFFKALGIN